MLVKASFQPVTCNMHNFQVSRCLHCVQCMSTAVNRRYSIKISTYGAGSYCASFPAVFRKCKNKTI